MKNVNESGRSMVEMLGVLAIVGVLSIGGIAGYTRAMNSWKANEIIDAMNRVVVAVETDMSIANGGTATYTSLGGTPGKIAGGLVSEITGTRTANDASVQVTWVTENSSVTKAIKEKLNCDGTGDTCYLRPTEQLYTVTLGAGTQQ